jgi:hypothetical protein
MAIDNPYARKRGALRSRSRVVLFSGRSLLKIYQRLADLQEQKRQPFPVVAPSLTANGPVPLPRGLSAGTQIGRGTSLWQIRACECTISP